MQASSKMAKVLLLGIALLLPLAWACSSSSDGDTEYADAVAEAMSAATNVADQQERATARAWEMAQTATAWVAIDSEAAEQAIADSVRAAEETAAGGDEQRGAAAELREQAATWEPVDWRSAIALAERIERNASRAWVLRAIAGELADLDPDQAGDLLNTALEVIETNPLPQYRAADESTVALELARLDAGAALEAADAIQDPAAKARAYRELASYFEDTAPERLEPVLSDAVDAAREISDPYDRAWALRESVDIPGPDSAHVRQLLDEAEEAAGQIEDEEAREFARSDIAVAWATVDADEAMAAVESIAANYPEARVAALVGIAEAEIDASELTRAIAKLEQALLENEQVLDSYEQARAVNVIVTRMAALDYERAVALAREIEDAYFQGEALRLLAVGAAADDADVALSLAETIRPTFLRIDALIAIGGEVAAEDPEKAMSIFEGALSDAGELKDTYTLSQLASAWAPLDHEKALEIADRVEDDADRVHALTDVALATLAADGPRAQVIFETAQETAQGIKSDDDLFAATAALRDLAAAWSSVDEAEAGRLYEAAFEAAAAVQVEPTG